jgi:hypothetical protein
VGRVGELGVRAQFRDNKVAAKRRKFVRKKEQKRLNWKLQLVEAQGLTSWCQTTWSSP